MAVIGQQGGESVRQLPTRDFFDVRLTPSQRMALLDVLTSHLLRPGATQEFIDIVHQVTTTPGDLVQVIANAPYVRQLPDVAIPGLKGGV